MPKASRIAAAKLHECAAKSHHAAAAQREKGNVQGNRVKRSLGDEASEELVIPGRGLAPGAER